MVYKPWVNKDLVVSLAEELFDIVVDDSSPSAVKEFASYDDRNFYLRGRSKLSKDSDGPNEFVLKITNSADSETKGLMEETNAMMLLLDQHGIPCSVPQRTVSGKLFEMRQFRKTEEGEEDDLLDGENRHSGKTGKKRKKEPMLFNNAVRLFNFLPGKMVRDVECNNDLFYKIGCFTAEVDKVLKDFKCSVLKKRDYNWDLKNLHRAIKLKGNIKDPDKKKALKRIEKSFITSVEPLFDVLPHQCIHGDINDCNLLVKNIPGTTDQSEVCGLIDFGDVNYTCRVFELAIIAAYMGTMTSGDPIEAAAYTVAGYQQVNPLTEMENDVILTLMEARLYQSICFGADTSIREPNNSEYLLFTTKRSWNVLNKFATISPTSFNEKWLKLLKGSSQ